MKTILSNWDLLIPFTSSLGLGSFLSGGNLRFGHFGHSQCEIASIVTALKTTGVQWALCLP